MRSFRAVVCVLGLGGALLAGTAGEARAQTREIAPGDQAFAGNAARDGIAEVALARLALQRSGSDEVRQFAQRMIDDHARMSDELRRIAVEQGIRLPVAELPLPYKPVYDRLSHLTGPAFDRAYLAEMQKDHDEAVRKFQDQAARGTDPRLRTFAAETLRILREHQDIAYHGIHGGEQK